MRFVFAKSRLRTRYKSLFLVFSGKLHDAIMSGQVSLTVENVFMENNFSENVLLDVDSENDVFGNRLEFVLPRMMYLLDNNNFQTALYFNRFCMSTFLNMVEMVFVENVYFWTGVILQNTGKMHLQHMQMHVEVEEFIFVLLQLEFGHSGRQSQDKLPLLVFVCCEKKVRARSSENLWAFDLRVFASLFIGIAA